MSEVENESTEPEPTGPVASDHLARDLLFYVLLRFGLVLVIAVVLLLAGVPLLVALAVALVAGLPLGLLLFRGLNTRVTAALALRNRERARQRARLRSELRGEDAPGDDAPGDDARDE